MTHAYVPFCDEIVIRSALHGVVGAMYGVCRHGVNGGGGAHQCMGLDTIMTHLRLFSYSVFLVMKKKEQICWYSKT